MSREKSKYNRIKKSHNSLSANKKKYIPSDRILLSVRTQTEAPLHALRRKKGSFTLEAAVVLPVFAAFLAFILFYFRILMVQQNLTEAMELSARELAVAAYAEQYGVDESLLKVGSLAGAIANVNKEYSERSEGEGYRYMVLKKAGINLALSDLNGDYVTLNASYGLTLPVELLGKRLFTMKQTVKARKWTGYDPGGNGTQEEEDIWVYIAPNGRVYHKDRDCTYLHLSVRSVPKESISYERNKNMRTYTPCEICGGDKNGSGLVYITDYGTSYHTKVNCSGLKRGIDMITLREAEERGYGACSRCG